MRSQKTAKSKKWIRVKKIEASKVKNLGIQSKLFFTSEARRVLSKLRQLVFFKTSILNHFDLKRYIQIETYVFGYIIDGIFSQLTSNDSSQWHKIAFFSQKMIPPEKQYKTYNSEILTIINVFKTWRHYLESCKHEFLVFKDHNNLQYFMDIKSLSFWQVRCVQKQLKYHFQSDYCQSKANRAVDALS